MDTKYIFGLLFFLTFQIHTFAQSSDEYYDSEHIRYDDYVYVENLKNVRLYKTGFDLSAAFLKLNSPNRLTLTFDDLSSEGLTYYYSFILCNEDWTPADLMPMEYTEGMSEEFFNSSFQSFNTTINYTYYAVTLPSENIKITKSGNYILKVYPEGDPDHPVITRRFYVFENLVGITIEEFMAQAPKDRYTKQELFVKISPNGYPMPNIYQDLTMKIMQNQRKDNMIVRHQPKIISSDYLYYNIAGDLVFNGGNEFRVFDIRSLKVQSENIDRIRYDSAGYEVDLLVDYSRLGGRYLSYEELNGNYKVIEWDNTQLSDNIEADYAYVNFRFRSDSILQNGGIYLLGELTNWRMDSYSRLAYNRLTRQYETSILLKQGYYNYQYIYVPNGSKRGHVSYFEGNHSETGNEYTVFVYYRDQGEIYDRLIGLISIDTNKQ
ncbi:MAG: DUF5103 domain-containing protein [Bacteroidales bacterium]|nr:DUF5103 domain-containing protein [Bacteroidales bacterium]